MRLRAQQDHVVILRPLAKDEERIRHRPRRRNARPPRRGSRRSEGAPSARDRRSCHAGSGRRRLKDFGPDQSTRALALTGRRSPAPSCRQARRDLGAFACGTGLRGGLGIEQEGDIDPPDIAAKQRPEQMGRVVHPVSACSSSTIGRPFAGLRSISASASSTLRIGMAFAMDWRATRKRAREGLRLDFGHVLPGPVQADHRQAGIGAVGIGEAGHDRDVAIARLLGGAAPRR